MRPGSQSSLGKTPSIPFITYLGFFPPQLSCTTLMSLYKADIHWGSWYNGTSVCPSKTHWHWHARVPLLILSDSCVTIHKLLFGGRCVFDVSRWTAHWCMSFARVQVVHWHGGASPFCRAGGPPGLNEPPQGRTWTLRGTNLTKGGVFFGTLNSLKECQQTIYGKFLIWIHNEV